jgi:hypothetical protein
MTRPKTPPETARVNNVLWWKPKRERNTSRSIGTTATAIQVRCGIDPGPGLKRSGYTASATKKPR